MSADVKPTPKQALRRYLKFFIPSMLLYVVFTFLAASLIRNGIVSGPIVYFIALLPGVAALGFLYAYFRFIREADEMMKMLQVEATMFAVAIILALCLTWGILEMFVETLPRMPVFWIAPIYFVTQGLAGWWLSKKYGAACSFL